MEQLDIKSLYEEELKEKMISLGEKPFKGKQLYQWLHQKAAGSYEEMTNLSEGLRKKLTEQEPLTHLEVVEVQTSKIDGTQKYLFQLADGNVIESVWNTSMVIPYAFLPRLAVGWDAVSVHPRSVD